MELPKKIDIGCGNSPRDGYVGVDLFVGAEIQDDITKLEKFPDNYVEAVNTAHILEHLKNDDVPLAMSQVFRVLIPGGRWDVEVPDFPWVIQDFLNTEETGRWGWKLQTVFGLQNHDGEYHKTGFSVDRMKGMLMGAGFKIESIESVFSERYNQQVIRATAIK
ncbi:MAG: hypothetical protein KCHDKBKB_00762 [Elusimicrobia bacterium]|nr:hypothetical protein [Elusimicrobiota bacterium]